MKKTTKACKKLYIVTVVYDTEDFTSIADKYVVMARSADKAVEKINRRYSEKRNEDEWYEPKIIVERVWDDCDEDDVFQFEENNEELGDALITNDEFLVEAVQAEQERRGLLTHKG